MSHATITQFTAPYLKTDLPDLRAGDIVRVHQKVKEKDGNERIQMFEGIVISAKHGKGISGMFTVRKVVAGIGVEKTFPLHSPVIAKIEILRRSKVRRAKLYYLRTATGKRTRMKFEEYIAPKLETKVEPQIQAEPEASPSEEPKTK
jgi:large subunit ribosomal protein L19